jgi:hypothetical protein
VEVAARSSPVALLEAWGFKERVSAAQECIRVVCSSPTGKVETDRRPIKLPVTASNGKTSFADIVLLPGAAVMVDKGAFVFDS